MNSKIALEKTDSLDSLLRRLKLLKKLLSLLAAHTVVSFFATSPENTFMQSLKNRYIFRLVLLILSFVGFYGAAQAQSPAPGDTIWFRGRKIVLRQDFTWQFVENKPVPKPAVTPPAEPEPKPKPQPKPRPVDPEVAANPVGNTPEMQCDSVMNSKWETNKIISYRDMAPGTNYPETISIGKAIVPTVGRIYRGVSGGHKGMDIGLRLGDTVRASMAGRVRHAAYNSGGFGNLVIIRHCNGLETFYAHLSKINVTVNQEVTEGQCIGLGGSTGRSVSPHLHFEMRYLDRILNPMEVFDFQTGDVIGNRISIPKGGYSPSYVFNTPKNTQPLSVGDDGTEEPDPLVAPAKQQPAPKGKTQPQPKPQPVANKPAPKGKPQYHTLQRGENLGDLAKRYNTTVAELCKLNGITKTTKIIAGKKLRVK